MSAGCIGDFLIVKGGKRLPKGSAFSESKTPHAYIRVTDFERNSLNSERLKYISKEIHEKIHRYTIQSSDVYISIAGTIGVAGIIPHSLDGSNLTENAAKLAPKEGINIYPKYLSYFLNSTKTQSVIKSKTMAVGVPKLAIFRIKEIPINLPPLDQQKKIAAILDAADTCRQKTKVLIEKYDALSQSLFVDMFGELEGDKVSLSSICEVNPKKAQISSLDRSLKVSFVPMANVSEEGELSLVEERTIDEVWSGFTYFQEDDVVFAKITPCMENGKGAIMRGLKNKIGFGTTEFHVLRPTNDVSCSEYLFYLTHSSHFRVLAELNMKGSAGQKRVPKDFFDRYKVVAPSIALQNQFAERVQAIEAQKAQAKAGLAQAEDLFNSLLQRAFKGELV